jgi:IS1 family transposase
MPRVLTSQEQCTVIHDLCEGASINSIVRKHGTAKTTILRLLVRVGLGCQRLHNRLFRGLACNLLQCDEIWSYVGVKEARLRPDHPEGWGEAYTFVALDVASRAVISYEVGKRGEEATHSFINDLRSRLTVTPQISTDGWSPYIQAISEAFGGYVDYAQTVKNYSNGGRREDYRYEPPRNPFITKRAVIGAPRMEDASTSLIERQNRTMRMHIRRMTRLCDAFSKKRENHCAATALHFAYYNLVRLHETIGTTPAVALGVAEKPWTLADLVAAALAEEETAAPVRGMLAMRPGTGTARELPNGKGFLRLVGAPGAAPAQSAPAMPVEAHPEADALVDDEHQGDLWTWLAAKPPEPMAPRGEQLTLWTDGAK